MKLITTVLIFLLCLGFLTTLLTVFPFHNNNVNTDSDTTIVIKPSDKPVNPDELEKPEEPEDEVNYTTLVSADRLSLGVVGTPYTYTSEDGVEYVNILASLTEHTLSEDGTVIANNYFNGDVTDVTFTGNNYIELSFPNHESGIYSIEYTVNYYGAMPEVRNYLKSVGLLNIIYINDFISSSEHTVDYSSDVGYTIKYVISFDFDSNFCSVHTSNVSGEYELNIFDISALASENTDGELKPIQYRLSIQANTNIPQTYEKLEIVDFMYNYHPEGSSIIPDEYIEDNAGVVIEGDYQVLASFYSLEMCTKENAQYNPRTYTLSDGQVIKTDRLLTDYANFYEDGLPESMSRFRYIGSGSGKYGENSFNIHLPNYESGTYIFTMDMTCKGSTSFFYPTKINYYLKTPGYLNTTHIFTIDKTKVTLASLAGYEFETSEGGSFRMEYIFDFDKDILKVNLIDLEGKSYSLSESSLEMYREYNNDGEIVDTKSKAITLRIQIPPDEVAVNPNNTGVEFGPWSFKKLIEN